jgi:hypothetical protein
MKPSAPGEWPALGVVTGLFGFLYWATAAPLYNPPGRVDPWLYTGFFVNFDWVYKAFWDTYYGARLPWVVPGYALHSLLPNHAAYFVLHAGFFFAGAFFAYFLVRRYVGHAGALVAYAFLIGTQLYYDAQSWDYIDGAIVTYLLGALCFSLTSQSGRRRNVELAAGGFFTAAAVLTNIFVVVFAAGVPLLYLWLNPRRGPHRKVLVDDVTAFACGAAALTLLCSAFSLIKGGTLLFWRPQLHSVNHIIGGTPFGVGSWGWVVNDARLFVPVFIGVVAGVVCARTRIRDPAWRFTVGSGLYLVLSEAFLLFWDLVFSGTTLQWTFYFSLLLPAMAISVGGVSALLLGRLLSRNETFVALGATVGAVAVPLALIYLDDVQALTGRTGTYITGGVGAMALVIVALAVAARWRRARVALAVVAAAGAVGTPSFAIDSSADVFAEGRTDSTRGDVYDLGMKLIDYLRTTGVQGEQPGKGPFFFWYRGYDHGVANLRVGMQSLYFYANTYLGTSMPRIDAQLRSRMKAVPAGGRIVLLCADRGCANAPAALERAGYRVSPWRQHVLVAGRERLWVRILVRED